MVPIRRLQVFRIRHIHISIHLVINMVVMGRIGEVMAMVRAGDITQGRASILIFKSTRLTMAMATIMTIKTMTTVALELRSRCAIQATAMFVRLRVADETSSIPLTVTANNCA